MTDALVFKKLIKGIKILIFFGVDTFLMVIGFTYLESQADVLYALIFLVSLWLIVWSGFKIVIYRQSEKRSGFLSFYFSGVKKMFQGIASEKGLGPNKFFRLLLAGLCFLVGAVVLTVILIKSFDSVFISRENVSRYFMFLLYSILSPLIIILINGLREGGSISDFGDRTREFFAVKLVCLFLLMGAIVIPPVWLMLLFFNYLLASSGEYRAEQARMIRQETNELKRVVGENFNVFDQEKINKAMMLMTELHKGQVRSDKMMCILHLLKVAVMVTRDFGIRDVDIVCAALLHDSVEDQSEKLAALVDEKDQNDEIGAVLDYLEKRFNERVRDLVDLLTNRQDDLRNKEKRNILYREYVRKVIDNPDAFPIKLADFSSNVFGLNEVKGPAVKHQLTNKYKPVIMDFVDRLEQKDCQIPNRGELAQKLGEAYKNL